MPIQIMPGAPIAKYRWGPGNKPNTEYKNASKAIHRLDYADLWGGIGTILTEGGGGVGGVRIDIQSPPPGGGVNLQLQLNGVQATNTQGTSVAHVLIAASLGVYGGVESLPQRTYILSQVKNAFFQSLNTGRSYSVTGSP
jgi:hypothetical protein